MITRHVQHAITVVLCVPSPWSPYIETMASHGTSGLGTTPRVFQSRSAGEDFQLVWPAACTCTRNLCQQGTEILLGGHVCSRASVPSTRAFMHQRTTREAVVTCGQTQHERESFMATPVYAHHPMPHLWGYQSNSQRKDASTRPLVVRNEKCHSWHITDNERNAHTQSQ